MPAPWHMLQHMREKSKHWQKGRVSTWLNQSQIPACAHWQQLAPSQPRGQFCTVLLLLLHPLWQAATRQDGRGLPIRHPKGQKEGPGKCWSSLRALQLGCCMRLPPPVPSAARWLQHKWHHAPGMMLHRGIQQHVCTRVVRGIAGFDGQPAPRSSLEAVIQ